MRFCFLLVLFLVFSVNVRAADDVMIEDFESGSYGEWRVTGNAFGEKPVQADKLSLSGYRGRYLANSFGSGDPATGEMTSPEFEIERDYIAFLIGGGRHEGETGIELLVDGRSHHSATGDDSGTLRWISWDVRPLKGRQARLRIFDRATGGWGHINIDHVLQTDEPRNGAGTWRLEDYRRSSEYYRERYRPQFHFTPELNWANDPNGLVYLDGEYHLFYQHNPHGNTWGHMSWGHAVSPDLVHWKHLPIALHEEYGVMAFSGSAVVDWKNTSGFGNEGETPLVAVYTGHGHGRQTQDLAYSNDKGRTWTKYEGNPVLDIGEQDFRDPKVFWHDATQRWIMVVALAVQKRLQFYGSPDLKQWTHLSDFGPAGAAEKTNWECPDLFELPIQGEPGKTKWVLEVDMGGGAFAGGSGGEYFIGEFDGERFKPDGQADQVRWVDYGRDFYAPVSWSDIPESDGRRIWIGWMNNWETSLIPTYPWRGAMSLPRSLSLVRTEDGLRLAQTPVRELQKLRDEPVRIDNLQVPAGETSLDEKIAGRTLEILAEFEVGEATEFGLKVRQGNGQETVIGYDTTKEELFVDRTKSGESDFHERFRGRHSGPLHPHEGRVRMHIFVDTSSVEVFGGRGETVVTDLIFPDPASQSVSVYSKSAPCQVRSLEAWDLKSAW